MWARSLRPETDDDEGVGLPRPKGIPAVVAPGVGGVPDSSLLLLLMGEPAPLGLENCFRRMLSTPSMAGEGGGGTMELPEDT